ncbi:MAG: hypothetical protein H7Y06_08735 [Opitutaceae bacterium]|nr:hypothetical protein [Opitutaceae bacterium]
MNRLSALSIMRVTPLLLLVVSAVLPLGLHAEDVTKVDATQRNTDLAPTQESADTRLSPGREANQRPFFRNEVVQDQRFNAPEKIDRKDATLGERRAPIDITETREKTIIERKDFTKPEVRERELNRHDGEKSRIQPKGDQVKKYDTVSKYQSRMADVDSGQFQRNPTLEKRTTFEKLNRFIFKRNAPGSENGTPTVTTAGGPAPASQDTYTKYQVDWKSLDEAKK